MIFVCRSQRPLRADACADESLGGARSSNVTASQPSSLASLLGFGNPKVVQALVAPLTVFRRGEPLALMPNVFVR